MLESVLQTDSTQSQVCFHIQGFPLSRGLIDCAIPSNQITKCMALRVNSLESRQTRVRLKRALITFFKKTRDLFSGLLLASKKEKKKGFHTPSNVVNSMDCWGGGPRTYLRLVHMQLSANVAVSLKAYTTM